MSQYLSGSKDNNDNSSDYIGEEVNFENIQGTLEENNSSEDSETEDEFDDEIDDVYFYILFIAIVVINF